MKNKKLLFSLLAVVAGIALLSLSATDTFNKPSSEAINAEQDPYGAAMEYLASLRNNQVSGTIDVVDLMKVEQMHLKAGGMGVGIDWKALGPDNFAGRTRSLIYDNQDPNYNTIIAASTTGGLWRSTTGGVLWDPIPGTDHIMHVSCMVQDPDGKIYVGTGETFNVTRFAPYAGLMGSGVYMSDDGLTFNLLPATKPADNDSTSVWAYINRLAVNPVNTQEIYVATSVGLKYSSDGGQSWVYAKSTEDDELQGQAYDVKVGSDGTTVASLVNEVYISASGKFDEFLIVSGTGEGSLPIASISRIELAIAPSDPNIIYAVIARSTAQLGQLHSIQLSEDKGETWRVVGPGGTSFFNLFGADHVGNYAAAVVVHPNDPYIIYAGGKNLWKGTRIDDEFYSWKNMLGEPGNESQWFVNSNHHIYAFKPDNPNTLLIGTDRGIYRSTDNLETFRNINKNYMTTQCYSVSFNGGKRVLAGTQSNGAISINLTGGNMRGERFDQSLMGRNAGHVFMSVINHRAFIWSKAIAAGATSTLPLFRSDDFGATTALAPFNPFYNHSNPTNWPPPSLVNDFLPKIAYWESIDYQQSRDSITFITEETIPAGTEIWMRSESSRYPFKYTVPVTLEEGDSIRVKDIVGTKFFYALRRTSTTNEVFMTFDAMRFTKPAVWYKILKPEGYVVSIRNSADGNYLWVGTRNGILYRLGNIHEAYDANTASIDSADFAIDVLRIDDFNGRAITSVAIDPNNNDRVVVTLGNYGNDEYVFRSLNATAANPAFVSVQGNGLPPMPVYSSLIEMNNPDVVILGTERGIYTTSNINSSNPDWTTESGEMGEVAVFHIKQQIISKPTVTVPIDSLNFETFPGVDNYGYIYAATFGRGVFNTTRFVGIGEMPEASPKTSHARLHIYPNPAGENLFIEYHQHNAATVEVSISDMSGRMVKHQGFGVPGNGKQTLQMDISTLNRGVYIIQLNDGNKTLSNKLLVR